MMDEGYRFIQLPRAQGIAKWNFHHYGGRQRALLRIQQAPVAAIKGRRTGNECYIITKLRCS